ncbi:isochorismate synthase [Oscillatoria sp. CS-180]|uniref:isochorismate synthase n=1 Tax=Oscillatoria sp. CS-180 TaxID=3021720 RepID=UPI002330813D|nr:isochorismate synthase [Oscillatoria sp. CS-180]MDB9527252.1 isochorismate synthase [Oscillatoria sp. CS-180]
MTVAPSRSNTLPHYSAILRALKVSLRTARQTNSKQIASLSFPLPQIDPLAILLSVPNEEQRQCYFESPSRNQAIAAWGELISEHFSGQERFRAARESLSVWQSRVKSFSDLKEGPYFFCSFSFFDTLSATSAGFAPATVLLTRWQVVRQRQRCFLVINLLVTPWTMATPLARETARQVSQLQAMLPAKHLLSSQAWSRAYSSPQLTPQEGRAFQQKVNRILEAIRSNQLQKQVAAHTLDVSRQNSFERLVALPRLRAHYPDCYIFSFSGKRGSHFIGASPERLLSIRQGRLVTDALAGSAPRGQTSAEDSAIGQRLLNTQKEQREHQLVLEFIVEQLKNKGLSPRYSTPPGLLRLSNIQHLHTPICSDISDQISPLTLVEALHPTPAVAGVPTAAACASILQTESCDRGLYAAPFGWVDSYGNSEFIVGIRSALIQGNQARLYAGAGIVSGSDPKTELAEIQLKLQALADALG